MTAARKGRGREWRSGKRDTVKFPVQMTRHLIVCEGTETEPRYFEGMKQALGSANGRKLSVIVRGSGKHTLGLLEYAEDCCRRAPETFDHVWLVYDKDCFPAEEFDLVERRCEALSCSAPCVPCALVESLFRVVAAAAPQVHDGTDGRRRLPAGARRRA